MTLIDASQITPMEKLTALQLLAAHGYNPETPKVKRAAEYLELWREKSIEAAQKPAAPSTPVTEQPIRELDKRLNIICSRWLDAAHSRGLLDQYTDRANRKPMINDLKTELREELMQLISSTYLPKSQVAGMVAAERERIAAALPGKHNTYAPTEYGKGNDDGYNQALDDVRAILGLQQDSEAGENE